MVIVQDRNADGPAAIITDPQDLDVIISGLWKRHAAIEAERDGLTARLDECWRQLQMALFARDNARAREREAAKA